MGSVWGEYGVNMGSEVIIRELSLCIMGDVYKIWGDFTIRVETNFRLLLQRYEISRGVSTKVRIYLLL